MNEFSKENVMKFLDKFQIPYSNNIRYAKNKTEVWIHTYTGKIVITDFEWEITEKNLCYAELIAGAILSDAGLNEWWEKTHKE